MTLPSYLTDWFKNRGWTIHDYQLEMFTYFANHQSVLLIAPTGGGKTLASFLPPLVDLTTNPTTELHTLYISPLKALTQDVERNLIAPVQEMKLSISIETRTGDTSSYRRQKQLKKPPHILLTTPESLLLLLSYPNAPLFFQRLKTIIIDELHSYAFTKRGDLMSLALALLSNYAPDSVKVGLTATLANPKLMAKWMSTPYRPTQILQVHDKKKPIIHLVHSPKIPYSGFRATYAIPDIYQLLLAKKLTLVFVNTRSQAEFLFHQLWSINTNKLSIAIYHGSLSKEQRIKTVELTTKGIIQAIITTSALELGIDWGNVDAVIQIGGPHKVSRLLQRIGRSNHQFDKQSLAYLIPTNCFDSLESQASINAIEKGQLNHEVTYPGSLDVVIQFIINCACSYPVDKDKLLTLIRNAYPYRKLDQALFFKLFQFAIDGGYTLAHYAQYHRLYEIEKNHYSPTSSQVIRRHRQNIGTIIESAHLRVKVLNKRQDKIVGNIEERFIQELEPGDTFLFAGETLEYIRLHNMFVETRKVKTKNPMLPSYQGGALPLSTFLADEVRKLINHRSQWKILPAKVQEWLGLQKKFSGLPTSKMLLIEQFFHKRRNYIVIYSFEGLRANHSLGMLLSRRLEELRLKPIHFTATDYGVAIGMLELMDNSTLTHLFSPTILNEELDKWLHQSSLLKRTFRQIAIISGLTERQMAGTHKSMKQVTFSTDLIYDVLKKYEPDHILLTITHTEVMSIILDIERLELMLKQVNYSLDIKNLDRPSPFAITILSTFKTEKINGEAEEELLSFLEQEIIANELMAEVRHSVAE